MDSVIEKLPVSRRLKQAGYVAVRSIQDLLRDNGPQWAAAIAYYSLLSIFPLFLAAVSIASFFVDPNWAVDQITRLLGSLVPSGGNQIGQVVKSTINARRGVSVISILLLLWSGSRVFGVLTQAINIAFDVKKEYGFWKRVLIEFAMSATLGLLFVLALASRYILQILNSQTGFLPAGTATRVLFQVVPDLLLLVAIFLIYRYAPRRNVNLISCAVGAVFATLVFVAARPLFLGYLSNFTNFNLIYGSLAIVVILMFWAWVVALIVLLGGEVTAEVQNAYFETKGGQSKPSRKKSSP